MQRPNCALQRFCTADTTYSAPMDTDIYPLSNAYGMQRYEVLDHTADLMIRARGNDMGECYANLAYGMFDQMVDLSGVRRLEARHVEVSGEDPEDALYSFLSELLFLEDCDGLILCSFSVSVSGDGLSITCDCSGEPLDRSRMHIRTEIKAVTFHMMAIDPSACEATVLFDV